MTTTENAVDPVQRIEDFTSEHLGDVVSGINRFRTSEVFCDAVLEVDVQTFPVHKCVLASISDFFFTLFTTEMREKYEDTIPISGVSATTLRDVLEFIYTTKITISEDNVYDILAAANYMMVPYLKQFCSEFLLGDNGRLLSPGNSIQIWTAGRRYDAEVLEVESGKYIAAHFDLFRKENSFLTLEIKEVKDILILKNIKKNCEEGAFRVLLDWVQHDIDKRKVVFPELFYMLELNRMDSQYLAESVASENLILGFHDCTKLVVKSLSELTAFSYSRSILIIDKRNSRVRLFDIGNKQERIIFENFPLGSYAQAVKLNDHLYVLGGEQQYSSTLRKLNLKASNFTWKNETAMPKELYIISASVMDVYIFAIGSARVDAYSSCQVMISYNSTTRQWTTVQEQRRLTFPIPVEIPTDAGCVLNLLAQGKYYFDTKQKSWKEVQYNSKIINLVQAGGIMYIFSQENPINLLSYDPNTKHFRKISTMQNARGVEKCCSFNDNIVAVLRSENGSYTMEEFNVVTNSWRVITEIHSMGFFQQILQF